MNIAILVREETMKRCTGKSCLNAFFQKKDAFARYKDEEIELVTFSHAGGDIDHKIKRMIKNGVKVIHLSTCMRGKAANYESLGRLLSEHFEVVGYTHRLKDGKEYNTIHLKKDCCQQ